MPRSSSLLALAVGALLAVPAVAPAAPVPAATAGPAYVDDSRVLQRLGLEVREDAAPHVVAVPKVAGVVPGDLPGGFSGGPYILRQLPRGGVVLLGKNDWFYRGPDVARLGSPEFRDDLGGRFGIVLGPFTSDGGMVGTAFFAADGLVGLDTDLRERWSSPFTPGQVAPLSPPFGLADGDRLYALGGTPSIVNVLTGAVIAPVTGLPAGETVRWVVGAQDGSARVLTVTGDTAAPFLTRRATLHRVGTDGAVTWSREVARGVGTLGIELSSGTVGADGATYLSVATTNGVSRWDGRVIGVAADGAVAWDTAVGDGPSRPAVDRAGNVWTATSGGRVVAITPAGELAFTRTLADRRQGGTVAAYGDGVLAMLGSVAVRLLARPAAEAGPAAAVRLVPAITLQRRPFRCVAPEGGRPKTCLYRIPRTQPLRIDAPGDGTAEIVVAPVGAIFVGSGRDRRPIRPDRRTVRVLAGTNLLQLTGLNGMLSVCVSGRPCTVRPGPYRVTVTLRTGGPARTFSRTIRVLPSTGRTVAY